MNRLLALTALLSLAYPIFSLINLHVGAGTPHYALWQWALALAVPALGNRLALARPRTLLWLFPFNLVLLPAAGAVFILTAQPPADFSAALPALIEIAFLWIPVAYLATRPLKEEDLRQLWESGLVIAALVALAREASRTSIPLFQPALLFYIAAGVALRTLAAAEGASTPDAAGRRAGLSLTVSFGVLVTGAVLGLLAEGRRFAALLLAALQAGWNFLRLLARYLVLLIDRLGLNRLPGQPAERPKIPGVPPPQDFGPGLQSAPLWVMIPLWTLLAVMLGILIWMLLKLLLETIAAWRREMAASIVPARRSLRRPDLRRFLAAAASLVRFLIGRLRRWRNRRDPHDLPALYDAFSAWGKRNRRSRRRSETPGAYLQRLEPELASACPDLLPALRNLTKRYERFCYGQNGWADLIGEEATLTRRLRKSRLHRRKFFDAFRAAIRGGLRKAAGALSAGFS